MHPGFHGGRCFQTPENQRLKNERTNLYNSRADSTSVAKQQKNSSHS